MGHVRLGTLPASRRWREVVALLEAGAPTEVVAGASSTAAERALARAADDPVFAAAAWLLVQLPLAARSPDYVGDLRALGIEVGEAPGLLDLLAAISDALDRTGRDTAGRTDLGEMAQLALVESLSAAIEPQLPSLFTPDPEEVRVAIGQLSSGDRFATVARSFFSRLTHRCLDYYLSRELANHIGEERRFATDAERRQFDRALESHCFETSRIVEAYAGGWYGKTVWQRRAPTRQDVSRFAGYGFKKIRSELSKRRDAG